MAHIILLMFEKVLHATIKVVKIGTPELKDVEGMENSTDPDHTAPSGAV